MKTGDVIRIWKDKLTPLYGKYEADAVTREAIGYLMNTDRVGLALKSDEEISDFIYGKLDDALARLLKGEPVQYVTGEAWFHGLKLKVTPDVLIPRPETSQLTDLIIKDWGEQKDLKVLDLCTGSGAIAIALARSLSFAHVTAVEKSVRALDVAKENAGLLRVNVEFREGDVLKPDGIPGGDRDIIVSNPPYIPQREADEVDKNVLNFEPADALFVPDDDPIIFYRRIGEGALERLTENGKLYFEINPHFANEIADSLKSQGFGQVDIEKDFDGKDRFVIAGR